MSIHRYLLAGYLTLATSLLPSCAYHFPAVQKESPESIINRTNLWGKLNEKRTVERIAEVISEGVKKYAIIEEVGGLRLEETNGWSPAGFGIFGLPKGTIGFAYIAPDIEKAKQVVGNDKNRGDMDAYVIGGSSDSDKLYIIIESVDTIFGSKRTSTTPITDEGLEKKVLALMNGK